MRSVMFQNVLKQISHGYANKAFVVFIVVMPFFGRSLTLVPLSFFAPKPHGNACYAGCLSVEWDQRIGCLRFWL